MSVGGECVCVRGGDRGGGHAEGRLAAVQVGNLYVFVRVKGHAGGQWSEGGAGG